MRVVLSIALGFGAFCAVAGMSKIAKADDWGCKVILCLANPGSPTQYSECVPPITKLYKQLARGGGFPSCSSSDFSTSQSHYEPYDCGEGFNLVRMQDKDTHAMRATCQSKEFRQVPAVNCFGSHASKAGGEWIKKDGKKICAMFTRKKPVKREKPNYIDVIIKDGGTRRVWY